MGNSSSSHGGDRNSSDGGSPGDRGVDSSEQQPRRPGLASRGLSHRITGGGSNNNASGRSHNIPHLNLTSHLPSPFRSGGSLGLSRAELDERCTPSGLYPTCEWEPKQIRRLIANGQLAARLRGSESRLTKTDRECPICFMYYTDTNISKCCNATLCTECYLQIKPGKDRFCICPFCNNPKMLVSVAKGMDEGDVARREEDEQRVIEATIRNRVSQLHGELPNSCEQQRSPETPSEGSFGSSLESYNRNRSFSNNSNASAASGSSADQQGGNPATPIPHTHSGESYSSALLSLAMTPEHRRALESEMRAQLSHETHRRMESEAEEARMRHAQEWYGSQAGSRARMREARLAELTGLLERMNARGGGGSGSANSNHDEEAGDGDSSLMAGGGDGLGGRGVGIGSLGSGTGSLAGLLRAMETSSGVRAGGRAGASLEDLMRLEAAFILGMDSNGAGGLVRSSRYSNSNDANEGNDGNHNANGDEGGDGMRGGMDHHHPTRPVPFSLGLRPAGRRAVRRFDGPSRGVSSTHLDTAELLMRGVSEEEQLAMAIAMSMQDAQQHSQQEGGGQDGGGEEQQQPVDDAEVGGGRRSGQWGDFPSNHRNNEGEEDDESSSSLSSSSLSSNIPDVAPSGQNFGGNAGVASLDEDEEAVLFVDA